MVLFSDDQVDDLANFCCNDLVGHKSLLYVDVTFQTWPIFVLMTTYKNTTVFTKRSDPPSCPLMIGPMMLCILKEKTTYLTLFQKLTAQVPGLNVYLQGYSTDVEVSLRLALAQEFERSLSFLCKTHAERNIKNGISSVFRSPLQMQLSLTSLEMVDVSSPIQRRLTNAVLRT